MNIATERLRIDTRPRQREIVLTFIRHSAVFLNMRLRPKKYILLSGLVAAVLIPLTGIGAPAKPRVLTAKAAMVIDADKGTILFKRNPYVRLPAASTVKVLTALMAVKQLDGAATVTISKRAAGISPSKVYLSENKQYKVNDLLSCLLICSANDAGVALAEAMAPSECRFSLQMNAYAKALGAKNSLFLNATGLPEGKQQQYSTVYDLCLFMKKSLRYPLLVKIMETKRMTIAGSDGKNIQLRNHNRFLWRDSHDLIGKTGYTIKARHCFLGMFKKGKRRFIVAIQGSRKPWEDLELLMNKRY